MAWMISLREHIDGVPSAPPSVVLEPPTAIGGTAAYCELLSALSESAGKAVPGVGTELIRTLQPKNGS